MKIRIALVALLTGCSTGLAGPGSDPVIVCLDTMADTQPELSMAVAGWDESAGARWRHFYVGAGSACNMNVIELSSDAWPCDKSFSGCTMVGGADLETPSATIYLQTGLYESSARLTLMHEMGHTVGLDDLPRGIMQHELPNSVLKADWICPDAYTIATLEGHIGIMGLHSCKEPNTEVSTQ